MCLKSARKQMSRICATLKKAKIKEKGEWEQNHVMEKRKMSLLTIEHVPKYLH